MSYVYFSILFSIRTAILHNVYNPVGVIVAILLGYLILTLILGAKRVYFDSHVETEENPKDDDQK
jgi:hypothetical protein